MVKTRERNDPAGQQICDSWKQSKKKKKSLWYECFYYSQITYWNAVSNLSVASDRVSQRRLGCDGATATTEGSTMVQTMSSVFATFLLLRCLNATIQSIYRKESLAELKVPQGESARAGEASRAESWEMVSSTYHKTEKVLAVGKPLAVAGCLWGCDPSRRIAAPHNLSKHCHWTETKGSKGQSLWETFPI